MRIVHACLRYPPALGGVETYVREIAERTRDIEAGRDVRVLTSRMKTHGPISRLKPRQLLNDAPYIQRLHHVSTPLFSYPRLPSLSYYLKHHKPDIIHGYSFWYQPADEAARFAKRHSIPFIFHPIYYDNSVRKKLVWKLYKNTIGRSTFAAANVVIVISPYEQSQIEAAGMPVKRFELISPGIDIDSLAKTRENPFEKRGIRGRILLAVGRIAESKGLADLIKVMPDILKKEKNAQLIIVGDDFGEKGKLESLVRQLKIDSSVLIWSKLSDEQLAGAYQHADVLVHPSYYEAFGIVMAESLAVKTPVVARRGSAISYVVPDGEAGLLFSDSEELTKNILKLLEDDNLREKLGNQGREYVKNNFSWNKVRGKILSLYKQLL